jgi:hypothetical protein
MDTEHAIPMKMFFPTITMAAITKDVGTSLDAVFEGRSVTWNGWLFDDAGQAQVTIDGRTIAIVDQHGPTRGVPFQWQHNGLQSGKHSLGITLLPQKNAQSKDHWINVGSIVPPLRRSRCSMRRKWTIAL